MTKAMTVVVMASAMAFSAELMAENTTAEIREHYVFLRQESATAFYPSVCEPVKEVIAQTEPKEFNYLARYTNSMVAAFEDNLKEKMGSIIWDDEVSNETKLIICAYYAGRALGGMRSMLELADKESLETLDIPEMGSPLSETERALQR